MGGHEQKRTMYTKQEDCEQEGLFHSNIRYGGVKMIRVGWIWSEQPLMKDFVCHRRSRFMEDEGERCKNFE